jgi:glycogen operon protein
VHGVENETTVTLPVHDSVERYERLWNSADERPSSEVAKFVPGDAVDVAPTSMQLFRAV